jgi:membrane-associated protease RseP (regulator of RpoE activity)
MTRCPKCSFPVLADHDPSSQGHPTRNWSEILRKTFVLAFQALLAVCLLECSSYGQQAAHIGVRAITLSPERAAKLNLSPAGAEITAVEVGSRAAGAGVHVGDVVLLYNGLPVKDADYLQALILKTPPGSLVKLQIQRNGQKTTIPIQTVAKTNATVQSPPIASSILDCLKGAGVVLGTELVVTAGLCSAELFATGQISLCTAILNFVLDNASDAAVTACIDKLALPRPLSHAVQ